MLGEGNGGGALALMPADRIIAAENAWLSPLPPEGASAIVYRDTDHAAEMARAQRVRASDLAALGIVDRIIPEHGDAADEPEDFCRRVGAVLAAELSRLYGQTAGPFGRRLTRYSS
jgi:acetyl-CoA carboxylase carboxyl transferase subunit beta